MRYAYSIGDCPDFEGSYETVDAALKAAEKCIARDIKKGFDPFVGGPRQILVGHHAAVHPRLDVDDAIEAMQDFADDYSNGIAGECNFLDDLTDDEKAKLDELLKKAIAKWATYIGSKATVDLLRVLRRMFMRRRRNKLDIMSLLIVWLAFCLGSGLSLMVVFGVTDYKRRRNCEWLRELQRIEDEEQARALSRRK